MNVPLAPELGLFLDKAFYDSYNKRWGEDRELLELDDYQDQIDAFKVRAVRTLYTSILGASTELPGHRGSGNLQVDAGVGGRG